MPQLERIWDDRNRKPVLLMSGTTAIIAVVDWRTNASMCRWASSICFPIIFIAGFVAIRN